ncbi:MAG: hypothetical protein EBR82_14960 [Caulobacteraceae bacterium]|nr:hypothetical protein [Caulobacteraceae bacterium]
MQLERDTLARMAIRLGRAYSQSWAKAITKDQRWDWETCKNAIESSPAQRVPTLTEDPSIRHNHSSTEWVFDDRRAQVEFYDRTANAYIGVVKCSTNAFGEPVIVVRVESPHRMVDGQLWRFDKAITSLSCDKWKPLYSLPPLSVIWSVLGAPPACPVTFYYMLSETGPTIDIAGFPIGADQRDAYVAFDRAFQRFKEQGGMTRWERAVAPRGGSNG